jgi:predicted nucleic acid-binding Zn ribbon protein
VASARAANRVPVRRRAPRPLSLALDRAVRGAQPKTLLACVQVAWPEIAGPVMAAETTPVSEREGVVTVACSGAVWAQELDLLGADLLARLAAHQALSGAARLDRLRFVVGSGATTG